MARSTVVLCLSSCADESLWRTALASQEVATAALARTTGIAHALKSDVRAGAARALLVDNGRLSREGFTPSVLAAWVRARLPRLALVLALPDRASISDREARWAHSNGIAALIPGVTAGAWRESLFPALSTLLERVDERQPESAKLEQFLRVLLGGRSEDGNGELDWTFSTARRLRRAGIDLSEVSDAMQEAGGVDVRDRTYRGKVYRACFVGSEAVSWIAKRLDVDRDTATACGELLRRLGALHHSVREQPFRDGFFYYRFDGRSDALTRIDLDTVAQAMRGRDGVAIADRGYHGRTYRASFVGREAVDWLCRRYRIAIGEAEGIGQHLIDLGVIHHVVDEHGFVDADYFYRFLSDERGLAPQADADV